METTRIALAVSDLTCGDVPRLERVLCQIPGIIRVYINPLTEMAYIEYDAGIVTADELATAAHRAGYELSDARRR